MSKLLIKVLPNDMATGLKILRNSKNNIIDICMYITDRLFEVLVMNRKSTSINSSQT